MFNVINNSLEKTTKQSGRKRADSDGTVHQRGWHNIKEKHNT
jgi:hypothetical protein